jgi:hypothetical protein
VQEGYDGSTGPSTANARQYSSYRMAMIRPYETLRYCPSLMWFEAPAAGTCASYANTLSSSDNRLETVIHAMGSPEYGARLFLPYILYAV